MKVYVLSEGWYDGVRSRIFKSKEEASEALLSAYEEAKANAYAPIEESYWNSSNAKIKTESVDDLWMGVIEEKEIDVSDIPVYGCGGCKEKGGPIGCPDAFTEKSQYCGAYDHTPI